MNEHFDPSMHANRWLRLRLRRFLEKHGLIPPGTQPRDIILPLLTVTVTALVSWSTYSTFQRQKEEAFKIDVAGRQRMLSQRLYRELQQGDEGSHQALTTLSELEASTEILRHGGQIQVDANGITQIQLHPASNPITAAKLDQQKEWIELATSYLRNSPTSKVEVIPLLEKVSGNADDIVRLHVQHSQKLVEITLMQSIALILLLAVFGLWLNRMIVQRKYRMLELAEAKEDAVQASHAKSAFLANMSHEIRTPLNAIIGMTDLLKHTRLDSEQKRFADTLKRAGDTLLTLVNDILDLSKIESGQIDIDEDQAHLHDVVGRIGEIMALRAHQKGLELTCFVSADVPETVSVATNRIQQALINLLGNAIKFTSAGEIAIRVEAKSIQDDDVLLQFSVSDTGIGIPENKFKTIFDSFAQAEPSVSVEYGGTGLGLAITKRLIEAMGGKIWVKSRPGVGSTFYFTLPAKIIEKPTADLAPLKPLGSQRILLVDDNDTNRLIVRRYLSPHGLEIDEATNGSQALSQLRQAQSQGWSYRLILLDYRMPGMNGLDVAETLKREGLADSTIVMLLTSDGKRNEIQRLKDLGVSEYMVKPIRRDDLIESMQRALQEHPQQPEPESGTEQQSGLPSRSQQTKPTYRVLVVDDVEDNRFIVQSYLAVGCIETDTANDGTEAVEKVQNSSYDMIFMDMRMSPMDGYTATQEIRNWERESGMTEVPIIALTAHALKAEISRAMEAGCNEHLIKPVTRESLFKAIKTFLPVEMSDFDDPSPAQTPSVAASQSNETMTTTPILIQVEEFLKARLPQYLENRKQELARLREALASEQFETLATIGHNVSGTAGTYGMAKLSLLHHQLEKAAINRDSQEAASLLEQIADYLKRVKIAHEA